MTTENNVIKFPNNHRHGFDKVYSILQQQPEMLYAQDLDMMIEHEIIRGKSLGYLEKMNMKVTKKTKKLPFEKQIEVIEEYQDKLYEYYIGNGDSITRNQKVLLTSLLIIYQTGLSEIFAVARHALEE
jgi:hypothetical protein